RSLMIGDHRKFRYRIEPQELGLELLFTEHVDRMHLIGQPHLFEGNVDLHDIRAAHGVKVDHRRLQVSQIDGMTAASHGRPVRTRPWLPAHRWRLESCIVRVLFAIQGSPGPPAASVASIAPTHPITDQRPRDSAVSLACGSRAHASCLLEMTVLSTTLDTR